MESWNTYRVTLLGLFCRRDYQYRPRFHTETRRAGFIRAEIKFIDNSVLHIREFVNIETIINRNMYAYQYMNTMNTLIFRYDNTPHHKKLNLPTYPHHKHDSSEENVIGSIPIM